MYPGTVPPWRVLLSFGCGGPSPWCPTPLSQLCTHFLPHTVPLTLPTATPIFSPPAHLGVPESLGPWHRCHQLGTVTCWWRGVGSEAPQSGCGAQDCAQYNF